MDTIMAILVSYFTVSLIAFMGIWKELENDYGRFWDLPRGGRILCRMLAIFLWPVYVMPCAVQLISCLLRRLYESIVE